MASYDYPLIVIGAGAGGLVVAVGAAKAGKRVLLIEKGTYGGDCTHFGCIPSKTLIASAKAAHALQSSSRFGITTDVKPFAARKALQRVQNVVDHFQAHENPEALHSMGVHTLTGEARFTDPHHLEVRADDGSLQTVSGRRIVIATGSQPRIPPLDGLQGLPYLTNETIFALDEPPEHLLILGGGAVGSELAQAFRRLGSRVSLVEQQEHLLGREEPEARQVIEQTLHEEGVALYFSTKVQKVSLDDRERVHLQLAGSSQEELVGSHFLIAIGRQARVEALNLQAAGITMADGRIQVDRYGRTSLRHVWAVGDVASPHLFTHAAENQARAVLTTLLLPGPFKVSGSPIIPRVTFTDPEVASVGLTEKEAEERYGAANIRTYLIPMEEVDRAVTEGRTEGLVKIVTKKWSSRILGATLVGPQSGDWLGEILVAMHTRTPLRRLASIIHPYPTYSLALRKAADQWLTQTLLPSLRALWPWS